MNMKISKDINGNKIVKLTFYHADGKSSKGFSIQTNGNLPETHRTDIPDKQEILAYVRKYGTHRQKAICQDVTA